MKSTVPPKPPTEETAGDLAGCAVVFIGVFLCFVAALALLVFSLRCAWTAGGSSTPVEQIR